MAKQLGRWRSTDQHGASDYIGATPRSGALLRSPVIDSDARYSGPVEIAGGMLVRAQPAASLAPHRTHDAVAPIRRPAARRDQAGEPEPGQLVCRLAQNGETGEWGGVDCDGNRLVVARADDGTLEIRHISNGEEDPDVLRQDANAGAPGERKAFEGRMAKALSPARDIDQRNPAGLRGLQALLNTHYRRA